MQKGILYLIPTYLAPDTANKYATKYLQNCINHISTYIVENEKTARHFLKEAGLETKQSELTLIGYGKHEREMPDFGKMFAPIALGQDVGLMSEAGCPAVADPGADIVAEAHKRGIKVIPLVGASSIMMALMASGFNGQSFAFCGYLPIDKEDRKRKIKDLEALSAKFRQTQIFIETPFRNESLLADLLKYCSQGTKLCIAKNITADDEWIHSAPIEKWKEVKEPLHKVPCIFLLTTSF